MNDIINLPRLRMKELQSIGDSSVRICTLIEEVKPALDKVQKSLVVFKEGMRKEQSVAVNKAELDKIRDHYTYGLILSIKAESYFNHNGATLKLVNDLLAIVDKYKGINRLPLNEQTAALDNMLGEIKKLDINELSGVTRFIPLTEQANTDFKEANKAFIEDSVRLANTEAAIHIAPQLTEDLNNLYALMFAYSKIGTNNAITSAYQELEVLVKSVR